MPGIFLVLKSVAGLTASAMSGAEIGLKFKYRKYPIKQKKHMDNQPDGQTVKQ